MIRKTQKIGASIKRSFLKAQKFKMISDQTKSKEFEKLRKSQNKSSSNQKSNQFYEKSRDNSKNF